MADKVILWEDYGYTQLLGFRNPFYYYVLDEDSITIREGIFFKTTKSIPLYRIAARELSVSVFSKLFDCGKIKLVTRGNEVPDLVLNVRNPNNVLEIIEKAIQDEMATFKRKGKKNIT